MAKKYSGKDRAIFLDGYGLGYRVGLSRLRYTDAPEVAYEPAGGGFKSPAGRATENWPGRKPCACESWCPVLPGCHICGWSKEELAQGLDKRPAGEAPYLARRNA